MADALDKSLLEVIYNALRTRGVLEGDGILVYNGRTVICIE